MAIVFKLTSDGTVDVFGRCEDVVTCRLGSEHIVPAMLSHSKFTEGSLDFKRFIRSSNFFLVERNLICASSIIWCSSSTCSDADEADVKTEPQYDVSQQ